MQNDKTTKIKQKFRGFLPIIIDIETTGINAQNNGILQIAAVSLILKSNNLEPAESLNLDVLPFNGAILDKQALDFLNMPDPYHPFRYAINEDEVVKKLNKFIKTKLELYNCSRAILVGHNAHFDLYFLKAMYCRNKKPMLFHKFSVLDTVTLSALAFGETVLSKSLAKANLEWDSNKAHDASYDAMQTAKLFCQIYNQLSPNHT